MLGPYCVAKAIVETRERVSWAIVRRRAEVGVVVGSPTPTPVGERVLGVVVRREVW